jgi:hypothetical protein
MYQEFENDEQHVVFWIMTPFGFCRNDVSEERIASITMVKRISELRIAFSL